MDKFVSTTRPDWVSDDMYPFESRFFTTPSGHHMHFVDEGKGEPVVFVHGNPSWSFEFRRLIEGLRSEFRCVAPDHVGFGLSSRSDRPRGSPSRKPCKQVCRPAGSSRPSRNNPIYDGLGRTDRSGLRSQASGTGQADCNHKHLVLAGRRRFSFQVVQLPDVELARPIPHQAPQFFRQYGDAESSRQQEYSDA